LQYADIEIWEKREAVCALVLAYMKALGTADLLRQKAGAAMDFGAFAREG
jgi:hypothetical protein